MTEGAVSYRFLSVIGEGGFGRVYRARMETPDGFNKEVAVKVLSDPDPPQALLKRFRDEAKILGLVRGRAIVGASLPLQIGGRWAVVMDFVDGVSCGALLEQGCVPPGVAVEIVAEIARALHHAYHQEGQDGPLRVLHRDIKPDNIQVTPSGEVRLLDFGIAKADFSAREFHTKASFGGTPGYIAPERTRGIELPVGDVFSLGVVLHELVVGTKPRYTPTLNLDGDNAEIATELDVDPALLNDPSIAETLRLAAAMRVDDPEARPSARQVEERCRVLRARLPAPYFRDWAEENTPHANELDPDEMVGKVLTTALMTSLVPAATRVLEPSPSGTVTTTQPTIDTDNRGLALGALLGGSAALLGTTAVGVVVLAAAALLYVAIAPRPGVPEPQPPEVVPVNPMPVPVEPGPVEPVPGSPDPVPVPVVPVPTPTVPVPAVPVVVPVAQPVQPDPVPVVPDPVPVPPPGRPTGLVIVRTIPSGASVYEGSKLLSPSGRGYELTVGRHLLRLVSPSGEASRPTPVVVTAGEAVNICYVFDTNSACDGDGSSGAPR